MKKTQEKAQKLANSLKKVLTKSKPRIEDIPNILKEMRFPDLYITHTPGVLRQYIMGYRLFPIFDLIGFAHAIGEDPVDFYPIYFEELREAPALEVWESLLELEKDPRYKNLHPFAKVFRFVLEYPRLFLSVNKVREIYMTYRAEDLEKAADKVAELIAAYKIRPEDLEIILNKIIQSKNK